MKVHPFAPGTIEAAKLRTTRAERLAFRIVLACIALACVVVSLAAGGYIDIPAALTGGH